jgi:hypothetical protein
MEVEIKIVKITSYMKRGHSVWPHMKVVRQKHLIEYAGHRGTFHDRHHCFQRVCFGQGRRYDVIFFVGFN